MAYDKTTDMQTLTVSAAFAQCQANFVALQDAAMSIAEIYTFAKSPIVPTPTTDMQSATKKYVDDAFKALYPVGSLYISTVSTNPATLLGFGTWAAFGAGKVMVGIDSTDTDFDVAEETRGAKTVDASHTHVVPIDGYGGVVAGTAGRLSTGGAASEHSLSCATTTPASGSGGSATQSTIQPSIVCYFFKRSA